MILRQLIFARDFHVTLVTAFLFALSANFEWARAEHTARAVKLETSNNGIPILEILKDSIVIDVYRFNYTTTGAQTLSLKVIGIANDKVYEFANIHYNVKKDTDRGAIYVATPMLTFKDSVEADNKEIFGSCSIVGAKGNVRATFEPHEIDARFGWVGAKTNKSPIVVATGEERILLGNCYMSTRAPPGKPFRSPNDLPYSSWKKDIIIKDVMNRKDSFVVLVLISSK